MRSGSGRMTWESGDRWWPLTLLACGGLVAAALMAVFGLPAVDLHGPLHRYGIMGPFCGGTRAARYTAMGHWGLAWTYNPLGILVVLGGAAMVVRATFGAVTGRWLHLQARLTPRWRLMALAAVVVLTALLEVRQQSRVDILLVATG